MNIPGLSISKAAVPEMPVPSHQIAYTAQINPSGSDPVLTRAQVWSGLELKIRAGQDFVGAILSTDVISEEKTSKTELPVTVREVVFKEGNKRMRERCIAFEPTKVEFHQPDGSKVTNVVSEGAGGASDMYMTYVFEWQHPEIEGNQEQLATVYEKEHAMAKTAVESTIVRMRDMVKSGKLE